MVLGKQLLKIDSSPALYVLEGICACEHVESSSMPPITTVHRGTVFPWAPVVCEMWSVESLSLVFFCGLFLPLPWLTLAVGCYASG